MKYGVKLIAVFLVALFQGCTTSYHAVPPQNVEYSAAPKSFAALTLPVYVKNPELAYEYTIFKKSGRFTEVPESQARASVTLKEFKRVFVCGNAVIISVMTLGLLPVSFPDGGLYSFALESDGQTQVYQFRLDIDERFSVWEWIFKPFTSSREQALAQSLKDARPKLALPQPNTVNPTR